MFLFSTFGRLFYQIRIFPKVERFLLQLFWLGETSREITLRCRGPVAGAADKKGRLEGNGQKATIETTFINKWRTFKGSVKHKTLEAHRKLQKRDKWKLKWCESTRNCKRDMVDRQILPGTPNLSHRAKWQQKHRQRGWRSSHNCQKTECSRSQASRQHCTTTTMTDN